MRQVSNRWLGVVLVGLLLVLMVAGVFLLLCQRSAQQQFETSYPKGTPYTIQPVTYQAGDVIRKTVISPDRVRYEMVGTFVRRPEVVFRSVLGGEFRLKDFPENKTVKVLVGTGGDQILRGLFTDSFDGGVSWKQVLTTSIQDKLVDREVLLQVDLTISSANSDFANMIALEKQMDTLIMAHRNRQYNQPLPDISKIVIPSVGWIKGDNE